MDVSQRIAVSGLLAHQRQLDVIANNIANNGTAAFKRAHADLADIGYQAGTSAPVGPLGAVVRLNGVGEGVQLADVRHDFVPGMLQPTGNPLDVAIEQDGFMSVALPNGQTAYTRDGTLSLDAEGRLVTAGGLPIQSVQGGEIRVPDTAVSVRINADGQLLATVDGQEVAVGQIGLVRFRNNDGLMAGGQNLWLATDASGAAAPLAPDAATPRFVPGAVEMSNVEISDEFTRMIQAQRGYQLNLRVVQAWDEVSRMAADLQR